MNFPLASPSTDSNLQFEREIQPPDPPNGHANVWGDTVEITAVLSDTFSGFDVYEALVSSFDFGACREIKVTAQVPGRDPIVSRQGLGET